MFKTTHKFANSNTHFSFKYFYLIYDPYVRRNSHYKIIIYPDNNSFITEKQEIYLGLLKGRL